MEQYASKLPAKVTISASGTLPAQQHTSIFFSGCCLNIEIETRNRETVQTNFENLEEFRNDNNNNNESDGMHNPIPDQVANYFQTSSANELNFNSKHGAPRTLCARFGAQSRDPKVCANIVICESRLAHITTLSQIELPLFNAQGEKLACIVLNFEIKSYHPRDYRVGNHSPREGDEERERLNDVESSALWRTRDLSHINKELSVNTDDLAALQSYISANQPDVNNNKREGESTERLVRAAKTAVAAMNNEPSSQRCRIVANEIIERIENFRWSGLDAEITEAYKSINIPEIVMKTKMLTDGGKVDVHMSDESSEEDLDVRKSKSTNYRSSDNNNNNINNINNNNNKNNKLDASAADPQTTTTQISNNIASRTHEISSTNMNIYSADTTAFEFRSQSRSKHLDALDAKAFQLRQAKQSIYRAINRAQASVRSARREHVKIEKEKSKEISVLNTNVQTVTAFRVSNLAIRNAPYNQCATMVKSKQLLRLQLSLTAKANEKQTEILGETTTEFQLFDGNILEWPTVTPLCFGNGIELAMIQRNKPQLSFHAVISRQDDVIVADDVILLPANSTDFAPFSMAMRLPSLRQLDHGAKIRIKQFKLEWGTTVDVPQGEMFANVICGNVPLPTNSVRNKNKAQPPARVDFKVVSTSKKISLVSNVNQAPTESANKAENGAAMDEPTTKPAENVDHIQQVSGVSEWEGELIFGRRGHWATAAHNITLTILRERTLRRPIEVGVCKLPLNHAFLAFSNAYKQDSTIRSIITDENDSVVGHMTVEVELIMAQPEEIPQKCDEPNNVEISRNFQQKDGHLEIMSGNVGKDSKNVLEDSENMVHDSENTVQNSQNVGREIKNVEVPVLTFECQPFVNPIRAAIKIQSLIRRRLVFGFHRAAIENRWLYIHRISFSLPALMADGLSSCQAPNNNKHGNNNNSDNENLDNNNNNKSASFVSLADEWPSGPQCLFELYTTDFESTSSISPVCERAPKTGDVKNIQISTRLSKAQVCGRPFDMNRPHSTSALLISAKILPLSMSYNTNKPWRIPAHIAIDPLHSGENSRSFIQVIWLNPARKSNQLVATVHVKNCPVVRLPNELDKRHVCLRFSIGSARYDSPWVSSQNLSKSTWDLKAVLKVLNSSNERRMPGSSELHTSDVMSNEEATIQRQAKSGFLRVCLLANLETSSVVAQTCVSLQNLTSNPRPSVKGHVSPSKEEPVQLLQLRSENGDLVLSLNVVTTILEPSELRVLASIECEFVNDADHIKIKKEYEIESINESTQNQQEQKQKQTDNNNLGKIFHAAQTGDVKTIETFIQTNLTLIDSVNTHRQTLLHVAATHRQCDVITTLKRAGANVTARDLVGRIPSECSHSLRVLQALGTFSSISKLVRRRVEQDPYATLNSTPTCPNFSPNSMSNQEKRGNLHTKITTQAKLYHVNWLAQVHRMQFEKHGPGLVTTRVWKTVHVTLYNKTDQLLQIERPDSNQHNCDQNCNIVVLGADKVRLVRCLDTNSQELFDKVRGQVWRSSNLEAQAAITIQSHFRMWQETRLRDIKIHKSIRKRREQHVRYALMIQRLFRRWQAAKKTRQIGKVRLTRRKKKKILQGVGDTSLPTGGDDENEYEDELDASPRTLEQVVHIQAMIRGVIFRRYGVEMILLNRHRAAIVIQRHIRGFLFRIRKIRTSETKRVEIVEALQNQLTYGFRAAVTLTAPHITHTPIQALLTVAHVASRSKSARAESSTRGSPTNRQKDRSPQRRKPNEFVQEPPFAYALQILPESYLDWTDSDMFEAVSSGLERFGISKPEIALKQPLMEYLEAFDYGNAILNDTSMVQALALNLATIVSKLYPMHDQARVAGVLTDAVREVMRSKETQPWKRLIMIQQTDGRTCHAWVTNVTSGRTHKEPLILSDVASASQAGKLSTTVFLVAKALASLDVWPALCTLCHTPSVEVVLPHQASALANDESSDLEDHSMIKLSSSLGYQDKNGQTHFRRYTFGMKQQTQPDVVLGGETRACVLKMPAEHCQNQYVTVRFNIIQKGENLINTCKGNIWQPPLGSPVFEMRDRSIGISALLRNTVEPKANSDELENDKRGYFVEWDSDICVGSEWINGTVQRYRPDDQALYLICHDGVLGWFTISKCQTIVRLRTQIDSWSDNLFQVMTVLLDPSLETMRDAMIRTTVLRGLRIGLTSKFDMAVAAMSLFNHACGEHIDITDVHSEKKLKTQATIQALVKAIKTDSNFADMWKVIGRVVEFFDGHTEQEEQMDLGDAVTMLLQRVAQTEILLEAEYKTEEKIDSTTTSNFIQRNGQISAGTWMRLIKPERSNQWQLITSEAPSSFSSFSTSQRTLLISCIARQVLASILSPPINTDGHVVSSAVRHQQIRTAFRNEFDREDSGNVSIELLVTVLIQRCEATGLASVFANFQQEIENYVIETFCPNRAEDIQNSAQQVKNPLVMTFKDVLQVIDALFALRHDRRGWSEIDESFQEVMRRLRLSPSEIPKRASPTERDEIYIQRFLKADLGRLVDEPSGLIRVREFIAELKRLGILKMLPPGKLVSQFVAPYTFDMPDEYDSQDEMKRTQVVDYVSFLNQMNKLSRRCSNLTDEQEHIVMQQIVDRTDPHSLLISCREKDTAMSGKLSLHDMENVLDKLTCALAWGASSPRNLTRGVGTLKMEGDRNNIEIHRGPHLLKCFIRIQDTDGDGMIEYEELLTSFCEFTRARARRVSKSPSRRGSNDQASALICDKLMRDAERWVQPEMLLRNKKNKRRRRDSLVVIDGQESNGKVLEMSKEAAMLVSADDEVEFGLKDPVHKVALGELRYVICRCADPDGSGGYDLERPFNLFDRNGTGFVDVHEFQRALYILGIERIIPTRSKVKEFVTLFDADRDGLLNYSEFLRLVGAKRPRFSNRHDVGDVAQPVVVRWRVEVYVSDLGRWMQGTVRKYRRVDRAVQVELKPWKMFLGQDIGFVQLDEYPVLLKRNLWSAKPWGRSMIWDDACLGRQNRDDILRKLPAKDRKSKAFEYPSDSGEGESSESPSWYSSSFSSSP